MLLRYLFGDDIFISYSHSDGRPYVKKLHEQLRSMDYSCFVDFEKLYAGNRLNKTLRRALRRSRVLLLVGTQGVRRPDSWVPKEVEEFARTGRTIIPININKALTEPRWDIVEGDELVWVDETNGEAPSAVVFEEVSRLFRFNRRNVWVRAAMTAVAVVLLAASAVAFWQRAVAVAQAAVAKQKTQLAEEQTKIAEKRTSELAEREKLLTEREAELKQSNKQLEDRNRALDKAQQELVAKTEEALKNAERAEEQTRVARAKAEEALRQTERARREQTRAESQTVVANARSLLNTDPELTVLLTRDADARLRAAGLEQPRQLEESLRLGLASSHVRALLSEGEGPGRYRGRGEGAGFRGDDRASAVAFSPDGKLVATASSKSGTRVWDALTGELKARLSKSEKKLSFSPDGKSVLMAGEGEILVWEWEKEGEITHSLAGTEAEADDEGPVSFGPGGRVLTASGTLATLRDARDGRALASFPHEGKVTEAGFSPEGEFLYTVAGEGDEPPVVNVWRADGRRVGRLPTGERRRVALGPRGRLVAEAAAEMVRVWDAEKGVPLATLPGHTRLVTDIRFSSDGRRILTASRDTTARVWDAEKGEVVAELKGHRGPVLAARFSRDDRLVLTASDDDTARLWDASTGRSLVELLGHVGPVKLGEFAPAGPESVVTLSDDGTGRVWDAEVARRPLTEIEPAAQLVDNVWVLGWAAFGPGGKTLTTVGAEGAGRRWDATTGRLLGKAYQGDVNVLAQSEDERLTLARSGRAVKVYETATGREVSTLNGAGGWSNWQSKRQARFDRQGEKVLMLEAGRVRVWDVKSGRELHAIQGQRIRPTARPETPDAAFSPDGRLLAVATSGRVEIWDTQTWRNLRNLPPDGPKASRLAVAFSPDGSSVAVAAALKVEVWSVEGERLAELTPGDGKEAVNDVDFSRDGRLIAAAGAGLVQVWRTKDWKTASVISEGTTPVFHLAFAPGDGLLMTENADGLVRLYPPEMFLPYEELLDFIPRRVSRRQLSEGERRRYLPAP